MLKKSEYITSKTVRRITSLFWVITLLMFLVEPSASQEDNQQTGDLNQNTQNTNSTVNSNNVTNSSTVQNVGAGSGKPAPVTTAISPSLMSQGPESCLISRGAGLQLDILGFSGGTYVQDQECNMRRDAKVLKDLGMSIAAVARMCQNQGNWKAMFMAGTPCPILVGGKMVFGKNALLVMKRNPELHIPDYESEEDKYNSLLGIGQNNEETSDLDSISISERFRNTE